MRAWPRDLLFLFLSLYPGYSVSTCYNSINEPCVRAGVSRSQRDAGDNTEPLPDPTLPYPTPPPPAAEVHCISLAREDGAGGLAVENTLGPPVTYRY